METTEVTQDTPETVVPAIRSDSVVSYLENISRLLAQVTADMNLQVDKIKATIPTGDTLNGKS